MAKNDCSTHAQNSPNPKRNVVEFLRWITSVKVQLFRKVEKSRNSSLRNNPNLGLKANHECSKRIMSLTFESIQKRLTLGLLVLYSSCLAKCSLPIAYSFLVAFISSYSFKGSSSLWTSARTLACSAHSLSSKKVLGGRKVELLNHLKCPWFIKVIKCSSARTSKCTKCKSKTLWTPT